MRMGEIERLAIGGGRRIAVVGAGVSGLVAAWLLSRHAQVTLFEAGSHAGGHTNTVDVSLEGMTHPVDTGFLVFNRRTYPNLCAMFALLGVQTVETDMSFGVSIESPELEWAGTDLGTVFAQRGNMLRPAMWRMLADILRFNREATRLAASGAGSGISLGSFLETRRFGRAFRDWYLLPMAAAIWSCPTQAMLDYPLETFVRFCNNHGLLQILDRPQWSTVRGGAREYVRRLLPMLDDVRLNTPVARVVRDEFGVSVDAGSRSERFDEIVFATHSDQTLEILGADATVAEAQLLGAIRYQPNRAVLHTDVGLLPRRKSVWSAWNYLAGEGGPDGRSVSVSYLINRLQPLPFAAPVIVSLNPFREPAPASVIRTFDYAHPVFDSAAIDAQARLSEIQGVRRSWFAGAWTGYGFHEDGLKSALSVVEALGASVPWRGEHPAAQTRSAAVSA
ncbi:MAG TPA: FAD-dependent oxidoreductase [Rhodocyclaceae bacterium]|nr:FAD-dependent oxidoreductase [Rhodocyclaceae bacterium]HRQ45924.1 FAD-dependent oxidoreductase [Rhodocyclaceae bacterium]